MGEGRHLGSRQRPGLRVSCHRHVGLRGARPRPRRHRPPRSRDPRRPAVRGRGDRHRGPVRCARAPAAVRWQAGIPVGLTPRQSARLARLRARLRHCCLWDATGTR
ncbi:hypothetical protein ACFPRL_25000 [Pseudoclavibacter helvolus]